MAQKSSRFDLLKYLYGSFFVIGFASLFAVAVLIPFYYPTQTLWYKVGLAKSLLLTGHVAGLLALTLLFCQLLVGQRPKMMERVFGIARLMRFHKTNGLLILACALAHVSLVILPEGIANLPLGWKYWPELVGAGLLCCLVITVLLATYRSQLRLPYSFWRWLHRITVYFMFLLAMVHVLFVSDAFSSGPLRIGLLLGGATLTLLILVVKRSRR
jgi:predicted ferric reductase